MAKPYSRAFLEEIRRTSGTEPPLIAVEITHPDLATPIRAVNDNQDLVIAGDTFQALGFRAILPDESEKSLPRAQLAVDNVGRGPDGNSLADWLELSGGGAGAQVRMMQVLRSDPDTIEWEVTLDLSNVTVTHFEVRGDLGYEDILNQQGIAITYRPETAPGLF